MCDGPQETLCCYWKLVRWQHLITYVAVGIHLYVPSRWGLSSLELSLIAMLLTSLPQSSCRDIPIYLPRASSKVPHRLVAFTLLEGTHCWWWDTHGLWFCHFYCRYWVVCVVWLWASTARATSGHRSILVISGAPSQKLLPLFPSLCAIFFQVRPSHFGILHYECWQEQVADLPVSFIT